MVAPVPTTSPPAGAVPPVASSGPPGAAPTAAPGPSAKDTAPKFGGIRGGKPRDDGLVPGSPEAKEADRKKDKLRKRKERQDPPALPAAGPVESAPQATPGAVVPVPGPQGAPVIPWDPESLKEVFALVIPTAEELLTGQITAQAQKARLPASELQNIERVVRWTPMEKKALETFCPRAAAKWLNRLHVPSGTQDEIVLATVLAKIGLRHVKLMNRLKQIAAVTNVPTSKTPETAETKKGTAAAVPSPVPA
jgi:hypothetical protein